MAGLFDDLFGSSTPAAPVSQQDYANQMRRMMQMQALMGFGTGMLQASQGQYGQPNRTFGDALAGGMQGTQPAVQGYMNLMPIIQFDYGL